VRLADFGLAKILAATVASTRGSMTPSYAAPEVIEGKFSRWSDQYSLAASYCELRTGRPPFEGENALQIIYAHVNHPPELTGIPDEERKALARGPRSGGRRAGPSCVP
jgi:serine/threonine protein kinase